MQGWNFKDSPIQFPRKIELDPTVEDVYCTLEELRQEYTSTQAKEYRDPYTLGIMIRNMENGDRCSIRCPAYDLLKTIRGNHPNMQYHFLQLNRDGQMSAFLQQFPQYTLLFQYFNHIYWDFVTNVHQSYVSYYVKKSGEPVPKKYFPIVYRLHHEIYIPSLQLALGNRESGEIVRPTIVNRDQVQQYLVRMDVKQLFYYMNYQEPAVEPSVEPTVE